MGGVRSLLRAGYRALLRLSWHLGGQKEHRDTGISVPIGGFVSEKSVLIFSSNILLGENVMIMSGAHLICSQMPPYLEAAGTIELGDGSIIRENAILQTYGGHISIGANCTVNPFCLIQGNGGVDIGDNTLIASHVCMYSANHVFAEHTKSIRSQGEVRLGIRIGSDVWVGGGAIILDGVTIGDGAVIAAGAVVNRDVGQFEIVAGVPCRSIGQRGV